MCIYLTLLKYLRDSFDLINRCTKTFSEDSALESVDIKALYTNLTFDLVIKAVEYWVTRFAAQIPLLERFNIAFIVEALKIILENKKSSRTMYEFSCRHISIL